MKRSEMKASLKKFVWGSALFSRAVATTLPMVSALLPPENAWAAARRDFDTVATSDTALELQAWLKREIGSRPVAEVVLASYSLPGVDRRELNRFWLGLAEESRDARIIEAVMAAIPKVPDMTLPTSRESVLKQWLVKTAAGGCYGNCGVGDGNGGGNGTGNEGDGVGPKKH